MRETLQHCHFPATGGLGRLDTLEFHVAAQLCESFGLLLTRSPKASRAETTERPNDRTTERPNDRTTERQWLEAGASGYDILRNGPELRRDIANLCRELFKNGIAPLVFNGE
ncbi:hypothetical protein GGQ68_000682 [Sagittula marina]|uniref:Uncharacterized protein n=1 Tax=Sagittula marina TaxID=943940 RepID=A0A7W6DMS9_9RHOB|nr:hypothetical protein [Sagittula marina]MBB3984371.1 hypothetical protein [Sagittula marina]